MSNNQLNLRYNLQPMSFKKFGASGSYNNVDKPLAYFFAEKVSPTFLLNYISFYVFIKKFSGYSFWNFYRTSSAQGKPQRHDGERSCEQKNWDQCSMYAEANSWCE